MIPLLSLPELSQAVAVSWQIDRVLVGPGWLICMSGGWLGQYSNWATCPPLSSRLLWAFYAWQLGSKNSKTENKSH